ncbi:FkbM family methyltransferase [Roseomonas sp. CCTCC AB2023176]|uniref:FkbM family methyltransferase n=1 Tax=Roseomonas sp. CCTCC AB2023176 TaxID=3342640 RepID=UPI0035DD78B4
MSVVVGAQRLVQRIEALDESVGQRLTALERAIDDVRHRSGAAQSEAREQIGTLARDVRGVLERQAPVANLSAQVAELKAELNQVARRQEEILAYLAARLNTLVGAHSIYLGDHVALTFLDDGQRIYVDTRDVGISSHLLSYGRWEPQYVSLFRRLVRPGARVLDLGANQGVYTLIAASASAPGGEVHAFEANPHLAQLTTRSVQINGHGARAHVHALAVGEAEGVAHLSFDDAWSGGGSVRDAGGGGTTACRVVALDDVFADGSFTVDVIKMDVEGSEGRALRGMRQLLTRSVGVVMMIEFAPEMLAGMGTPAPDVTALLAGLGFRAWTIRDDATLEVASWSDLAALREGVRNILVSRHDPFPG